MPKTAWVFGIFGALVAVAALSANAKPRVPLPDSRIQELIARKLAADGLDGVDVAVNGGAVTLRGKVPSLWAKEQALGAARGARDVQDVLDLTIVEAGASDRSTAEEISNQISQSALFTMFDDVAVAVKNGLVTLTGSVTHPEAVREFRDMAARVAGVWKVDNRIVGLPDSPFDEQLRNNLAAALLNDPLFFEYSQSSKPPLHILVNSGHVTLVGVVRSQAQRQRAEMLARSSAAKAVENRLQVEE